DEQSPRNVRTERPRSVHAANRTAEHVGCRIVHRSSLVGSSKRWANCGKGSSADSARVSLATVPAVQVIPGGRSPMDERSRRSSVLRVLGAAATEPAALLVAGASPVVAAVLGSWLPLALGLFVYLLLVVRNAFRPAFWSYVLEGQPIPTALPDPNH